MSQQPPVDPNSFRSKFGRWWAQQSPTRRLVYYGVVFVFVVGTLSILNRMSPQEERRRRGRISPPAVKAPPVPVSPPEAVPPSAPVPPSVPVPPVEAVTSNIKRISKQELGKDYPFTVSEGDLSCRNNLVLFTANGETYAVNGTARSSRRYKPIDEIWAEHESIKGAKIDLSKVIEMGLELCR
jgi:hypothetical protein